MHLENDIGQSFWLLTIAANSFGIYFVYVPIISIEYEGEVVPMLNEAPL